MRIPVSIAAALVLLCAAPAAAQDLEGLRAAAEAWPQDYATQLALARAADAAEDTDLALQAWQAAFTVSGGNLDSSLGLSMALLADGQVPQARAAAKAAVAAFPESTLALRTHAWTLRHAAPNMPGTYGFVAAERAYVAAYDLEPTEDDTLCGAAWTRFSLGAPVLAREDFVTLLLKDSGDPCAVAGTAATRPMIRAGGGFNLTGTLYQDHDTNLGGFNALIFGNVTFADLVYASIYGRFMGIAYDSGSGTQDYRQDEIWGRVGISHLGFGGQLLAGAVGTTSSTSAIPVFAWQGWATFGPTLRAEGTWASYDDGNAMRGGLGLRVPVTSFLDLDGGVDISGLITTTGQTGPYVSAHLSALVRVGPLTIQPGFRAGNELRPVRIDEPSVWNTTDLIQASAFLDGTVNINPNLDLTFGYEVLRLKPTDGSDVRHTHVISLGLAASGTGGLRK